MSEEILNKESEEMTEEELAEKRRAAAEQDSSDEEEDEEEVEESKTSKASVKKEEEDEEEEEEPEVAEGKASVKKEEGEEEEEGDEEEEVPAESKIPSTKNQMLKNIYDQVNGMLKADLAGKYEQIMASTSLKQVKEVKEESRTQAAVTAEDIGPINVQDDVQALVQGEEGLSEEFKQKASTIFEAAVHAKVVEEVNAQITGPIAKEAETQSAEFQKELTEKVDGYLTYVVEEWMKENELAIERGIRSELVEDFMSGIKTLFTEHYIDLPEEKVDMVDDLFTKVEDLETSLDEEINRGVELQKELAQFKKDDALKQSTKDLADTDSEKIAKLAEGIEFENTEQYIEKLSVLKESYFPKADSVTSEITETDDTIELTEEQSTEKLDESMQHYTSAIKRYNS